MNRVVAWMLALGFSLIVIALGWAAEINPTEVQVVAEIERLGDTVTLDEKSPDKPVVGVDLHRTRLADDRDQVTDVTLERLIA